PPALSQRELADRFGPSRQTYDRLTQWLRTHGLTIVQDAQNRLTISARGTRAAVERALAVRIGDRVFYANDGNPGLPPALAAHVQSITGLSDLAHPRPVSRALRRGFYK